jgi:secreted PhoX family phosphatase
MHDMSGTMHDDESAYESKAAAAEAADDIPNNPDTERSIGAVIARRFSRREMLKGSLGVTAATALFGASALNAGRAEAQTQAQASGVAGAMFEELAAGVDERHHVAAGYEADVLLRWGDPLFPGMSPFDPRNQTGAEQARRFGYNNDYVAFFPLGGANDRGLLCVNHEYTSPEVMFPGVKRVSRLDFSMITEAHVGVEMAAHGVSVVEITRDGQRWHPVLDSRHNRRITASTPMTIDGPAAGHARLKTAADPSGTRVLGTLNNCAGGNTPWGTYLTAEENFHGYFWTDAKNAEGRPSLRGHGGPEAESYARYRIPSNWYSWGLYDPRFNVDKELNEPNRFGWIVEIDPTDPTSTPVKHTALGRFSHEGAESLVNADGRVVVYSGDDGTFEYIYRFVSRERYREGDRAHNIRLLSEGTLSVARFNEDGSLEWLPLVFGEGPLTPENGFHSQADVLIDARIAGDLLKATPMDRPEDVQPAPAGSPSAGKVYAMLTNNSSRKKGSENVANPRAENAFGHIIEMTAPGGDHAAPRFTWDLLIKCGDPAVAEVGAMWNPATTANGWFGSPDNCAFDSEGRLWVSTDQGNAWPKTGKADGLYAVGTEGAQRAQSRLFFRTPVGAELCGPYFTPDGETLFVAVQHPATDGVREWKGFGRPSTFEDPATRWPDFDPNMPPRPSVLVIHRKGGGRIAS